MRANILALGAALSGGWFGWGQPTPIVMWQATYGGTGEDRLFAGVSARGGGFLLAGSSWSGPSGTKTAPNYGQPDFWLVKTDAQGAPEWDASYGGSGQDTVTSLLPLPDGGYLVGGYSWSAAGGTKRAPNYGGEDFWIVKVSPTGVQQWDRSYGGSGSDILGSMLPTADGGFLLVGWSRSPVSGNKTAPLYETGPWGSDGWVVKIDANGEKLWDWSYGGDDGDVLFGAAAAGDGAYVLCGYTASLPGSGTRMSPTYGRADAWMLRITGDGTWLPDRTFGGSGGDYFGKMTPTADGGYLMVGSSESAASDTKTSPNHGLSDLWVVKLDARLKVQWDQSYGGSNSDGGNAAIAAADGGYWVLGDSYSRADGNKTSPNRGREGTGDLWLLRLDGNGLKQWEQTYGGSGDDYATILVGGTDGTLLVGGSSESLADGNKTAPRIGIANFWVLKLGVTVPPVITRQPQGALVGAAQSASFSVTALSPVEPVRYQWRLNGADLLGATNLALNVTNAGPAQAGNYTVLVSNQYGSTESEPARVTYTEAAVLQIGLTAGRPALTSYAPPGKVLSLQFADSLRLPVTWRPLLSLTNGPVPTTVTDPAPASFPRRYYRAVEAP